MGPFILGRTKMDLYPSQDTMGMTMVLTSEHRAYFFGLKEDYLQMVSASGSPIFQVKVILEQTSIKIIRKAITEIIEKGGMRSIFTSMNPIQESRELTQKLYDLHVEYCGPQELLMFRMCVKNPSLIKLIDRLELTNVKR